MKGLENAIRNLNSLDTRMVPQASAWAINRVAQKAVSVATRQVAGNTVAGDNQVKGIPLKLVRQRVRVFKASPSGKMTARIRVNRGNLPAIKLGTREMQFVMRLAREFRRADWRRMLSEMSATELGEWGDYFRMQSFSDVWMDAQFASLKALIVRMVSGSSDAAVADFSLLPEENGIPERTDEELMHLGEGISGGVRYGPDSQPGH